MDIKKGDVIIVNTLDSESDINIQVEYEVLKEIKGIYLCKAVSSDIYEKIDDRKNRLISSTQIISMRGNDDTK